MGNDADSPMWREEDQKMAPGLQEAVNNMLYGQPDPDRTSSRAGSSAGGAGWDRVQADEDEDEENARRGR